MTEQGSNVWGLTVSRRFDTPGEADGAAEKLKQAGFGEGEIRVWQHKKAAASSREDTLARTVEGLLAGGVIGGLAGLFFSVAITWASSERVTEESPVGATLVGAVAGAIIVAIAVSILSRRFSFSHPHETHGGPASVVTVTAGDRESEAKQVFDSMGG